MVGTPMNAQQQMRAQMDQNVALRKLLLSTSPKFRKNLGTFTQGGTAGGTTRVLLQNTGLMLGLTCEIVAPLTIAVQNATVGQKAPWNLIRRIRLTDYDNVDRVILSGWQLWQLLSIRYQIPYGYNNFGPGAIVTHPNVPVTIGAAVVKFLIEVPAAFDRNADLRGAIMNQTAIGQMFLNIDWNASLVSNTSDNDSVYNGGVSSTVVVQASGIAVTVFQDFLMPQQVGGIVPIPNMDLMTVYELNGAAISSDNIVVNGEKLIPYPNGRSVIGAYFNFMNGGSLLATDLSRIRLLVNGSNTVVEYDQFTKQIDQRNLIGGDLCPGFYFILHRDKSIDTALFGNVQIGFTPSTVNAGNTYWEYAFESFYLKGASLPGIPQP